MTGQVRGRRSRQIGAAVLTFVSTTSAVSAAPENSVFSVFLHQCVPYAEHAAAPLNAAAQQGWTAIDQRQLVKKLPPFSAPGLKTNWYRAYVSPRSEGSFAVFAGQGEIALGTQTKSVAVAFCMVARKPNDAGGLKAVQEWSRADPYIATPEASAFLFDETPAGRRGIALGDFPARLLAGTGREVVSLNHPAEHITGILLVSPVEH